MRYTSHTTLQADALRLCEDMRVEDTEHLYRSLAGQCAADPERMAQTLMALAAWVDVDSPVRVLERRAAEVAELNREAQRRKVPGRGPVEVILRSAFEAHGISLRAGDRFPAEPVEDGEWLVHHPEGQVRVPESAVRDGAGRRARLLRQRDAWEEYEFLRWTVRVDNDNAVRRLSQLFGVSFKTLREWGFETCRVENQERHRKAVAA